MIEPWAFIVVALCSFRVTRFVVYDKLVGANPQSGSAFSVWLDTFGYGPDGIDRSFLRGKLADLLTCPWCSGFWLTLGCWAAWVWGPEWARVAEMPWAIHGAAMIVMEWTER